MVHPLRLPLVTLLGLLAGTTGCDPAPPAETSAADAEVTALPPSPTTQVVLLGTGTPNAEPDRSGPALAVVVDGVPYLVDAGPGLVRRAAAASERGVEGLAVERLATVFLTHLHSDHTLGLPDLIFTPWVLGRDTPLRVFGPPGAEAMVRRLEEAYRDDVRVRVEGSEPANETGHGAEVTEVREGLVYQDDRVKVTAFRVSHGDWEHAFGYRFETPDRTVVVSGDTRPTEAIVEQCRGCDILVHEVYSRAGWDRRTPEWQAYHAASHTSGVELGELAARAEPGLLVLTHQLLWGSTAEELVAEVRRAFPGAVAYGRDLDVF